VPSSQDFRLAAEFLESFTGAVAAHGANSQAIAGRGTLGCWAADEIGCDSAVRAAAAMLRPTPVVANTFGHVSFGIGIAVSGDTGRTYRDTLALAFRLAAAAERNCVLVAGEAYERTVDQFDFRGLTVAAPKADPLPVAVFQLLGPKPPRSGTHHVGPENVPLVGRRELLDLLNDCRGAVANGHAMVLHVIGEPGAGKSRLLREWLAVSEQEGQLGGWLRLRTHGVPYGGYALSGWQQLVSGLRGAQAARSGAAVPTPTELHHQLRVGGRPVLIVVDDLHWIDIPSRSALAAFLRNDLPMLVILAYRPSFTASAPAEPARIHRHVRLTPLRSATVQQLIMMLAKRAHIELAAADVETIAANAQGSPLYAEEAVAHLAALSVSGRRRSVSLPPSLPKLLMARARWTAGRVVPELERRRRSALSSREAVLRDLDGLEEQLASWLDRFDVIEDASDRAIRSFLTDLSRIDGQLAIMNLLAGRQRPHQSRLAQALKLVIGSPE